MSAGFKNFDRETRHAQKRRALGSRMLLCIKPFSTPEPTFRRVSGFQKRRPRSQACAVEKSSGVENGIYKASFTVMRSTYKQFVWRATRPVNTTDCMNEWLIYITDIFPLYVKKYLHSLHNRRVYIQDAWPAKQIMKVKAYFFMAPFTFACITKLYELLLT